MTDQTTTAPPGPGTGAVAIVGASDSTPWTYWLVRNLREHGFTGDIWPINPKQPTVLGLDAFTKVSECPGPPDVAVCVVRPDRSEDAVADLLTLGCREIVIVSNGFRETGQQDDIEREQRLVDACREAGARLVGPNCVGFADLSRSLCAIAEPVPAMATGDVSVVSQSGALLSALLGALDAEGIGVDAAYSIGNGTEFGLESALDEVAARDTTNTVVVVMEGAREPDRFTGAVAAARARGKEVVAIRLGRSAASQEVARSHTGAVVGSDRLVGAWLDRLGVVQASTVGEAAVIVALRRRLGHPEQGAGVFVITGSGGGAQVAADAAARHGVRMAELGSGARSVLEEHLPASVRIGNPLDLAGAGSPEARRAIYQAIYEDPGVAAVLEPYALQWPDDDEGRKWFQATLLRLEEASNDFGTATVTASIEGQPLTPWMSGLRDRGAVYATADLEALFAGLGRLLPGGTASTKEAATTVEGATRAGVVNEAEGREMLADLDLPVVRGRFVDDAAAAQLAAEDLRPPYVVKVSLPGVGHKARIGGVRIGLATSAAVAEACADIARAAADHGISEPPAFLVQEMVFGPEVLVGMLRDPVAGPVLNAGVGGWAAELNPPALTMSLPAAVGEHAERLVASGLAGVLGGHAAALVPLLERLSEEFERGGLQQFTEVECNPVVLTGDGPRIVDVMAVRAAGPGEDR